MMISYFVRYHTFSIIMVTREKITITLRSDLIKRVDKLIDTQNIRNRSHAIEYLLTGALKPSVRNALILAGGKGTGARPLTRNIPKSLLPINGRSILEHQIDLLKRFDIRTIFIVVGYLGHTIKNRLGDGKKFDVNITYLEQDGDEIGTAHGVFLAKSFLSGAPFLMMYGDVLAQINLQDFIEHHSSSNCLATLALTSMKYPSLYGVATLRGEKIVGFAEKPKEKEELSRVISAGIACFEPEIFNHLSNDKNLGLERDVFPQLAKQEKLDGYLFEGKWFDIGTKDIYQRALKEWR